MFPDESNDQGTTARDEKISPLDDDRGNDAGDGAFEALLVAFDEGLVSGSTANISDLTLVPPELADELRGAQDCLSLLHAASRAGQLDDLAPSGIPRRAAAPATLESIDRIGRFEIVRELGRGGYGIVFLALDPNLGRRVALKVPRPEALVTPDLRRRFLREAEAAGSLHHPNLVTVYEVGEDGPLCYLVTEYCDGPTLAQWLKDRKNPVSPQTAAQLVVAVAEGVEHAQQSGVLHRDIKPSNVMLEPVAAMQPGDKGAQPLSAFTPKLTDFGLAKLLERSDDETRTGTLLGTPAYMAPEQAAGRMRDICAATDVYGLGVVLYEILTGRPPLRGENDPDTLRQVCVEEPMPPRRLRPGLPRDLEAICLKCLEKKPSHRYVSAGELARDLRRFLAGEPTLARPRTAWQRVLKWGRRRPATAALVVVSFAAVLLLSAGGWFSTVRTRSALNLAEQRRVQAEASEETARSSELKTRRVLYASELSRAMVAWEANDPQSARKLLDAQYPQDGKEDLREFAWRYVYHAAHEEDHVLEGHTADVFRVRFSPDGTKLASASKDHEVRLWNVNEGSLIGVLRGHTNEVLCVSFSVDGRRLASVGEDGKILLWDVDALKLDRELFQDEHELHCVSFSPDGSLLAAAGASHEVRLWQTTDWKRLPDLVGHRQIIQDLDFSPDSARLATACDDGTIRIWEPRSGRTLAELLGHGIASVRGVSFLPDGKRLVSAGQSPGTARLWDLNTLSNDGVVTLEQPAAFQQHADWLLAVTACPDNRSAVLAARDGIVELVDVETRAVKQAFNGHEGRVWNVCLSPDGKRLATCGEDKTIRIWSLTRRAHWQTKLAGQVNQIYFPAEQSPLAIQSHPSAGSAVNLESGDRTNQITLAHELEGDFDGDGKPDRCVFEGGRWTIWLAANGGQEPLVLNLGDLNDLPVVGDWNGDGKDKIGVFREGNWSLDIDGKGAPAESLIQFGGGTSPMVGDWDGDGSCDIGARDGRVINLRFHHSSGPADRTIVLPASSDRIVVGDWDGDGGDDIGYLTDAGLQIDLNLSGGPPEFTQRDAASPLVRMADSPRVFPLDWLDASFGERGRAAGFFRDGNSVAQAMALQGDGKILISGTLNSPTLGAGMFTARLDSSGQLDPTFGKGGIAICPQGFLGLAMKVQADGKIIVAGAGAPSYKPARGVAVRYLANGQPDASFGDAGVVLADLGNSRIFGLAIQPDGKIVLVGGELADMDVGKVVVFRLNGATGALDSGFGSAGVLRLRLGSQNSVAVDVAIQADGNIVAAGDAKQDDSPYMAVIRLLGDTGKLDPSFGEGGVTIITGCKASATKVRILADGKILVVGEYRADEKASFPLVRLSARGQLDPSFQSETMHALLAQIDNNTPGSEVPRRVSRSRCDDPSLGWTGRAPVALASAHGLDLMPDGKIVVGGLTIGPLDYHCAVDRYETDGRLDESFGACGRVMARLGSRGQDIISDLAVQPDGRIVAVGVKNLSNDWRTNRAAVLRLMPSANVDAPLSVDRSVWKKLANPALSLQGQGSLVAVAQHAGIFAVAFPNNRLVRLQSLVDGRELATIRADNSKIDDIALSNDARRLAVVSAAGEIQIWDVASQTIFASLPTEGDLPKLPHFSPRGDQLAFAYDRLDYIALWDFTTKAPVRLVEQSILEDVNALVFSPDGKLLATTGDDRLVKFWGVDSLKQVFSLSGHQGRVSSIAFSPDGRTFATGSDDRAIKLWDLSTRQQLVTLHGHATTVTGLFFRPDGRQLVSVGQLEEGHSDVHVWSTRRD